VFLAFAILALAGAFSLLLQRNLVLAGFSMALSLLGVAGLYLCLAHPAAAAFQVIVYAGAIVVLILFVVMMLNRHAEEPAERSRPVQRWGSLLLVLGLGAGSAAAVLHSRATAALSAHPLRGAATLEALGTTLFREHLLALEATGLLLLAAMVAAVSLVKKEL
jgi:NADH-quinone oxidoreductase subunit J